MYSLFLVLLITSFTTTNYDSSNSKMLPPFLLFRIHLVCYLSLRIKVEFSLYSCIFVVYVYHIITLYQKNMISEVNKQATAVCTGVGTIGCSLIDFCYFLTWSRLTRLGMMLRSIHLRLNFMTVIWCPPRVAFSMTSLTFLGFLFPVNCRPQKRGPSMSFTLPQQFAAKAYDNFK